MSHACITCVCCVMWLNQNTWSQKCVSTYRRRNVFWPRMSDIPSRLNPFQRQTWLIRRNRNEPWLSSDYPNCRSRWNGLVLNPCWHHPPPTTFPGASTERDYYFPSCTFRYKEINVIQSVDERRKGKKAKKSTKFNLPFSLRFGLHRRHGSFDRYRNHEIAQRGRRCLSVGVELVVQAHVRLWRLALPIGHQVQRRRTCATLSFHLILNHFQRHVHTHTDQKKRDVSNAQVKNGPLKIEVKREIEREYSSSFFLGSIYVILSCLCTLRISTLK